MQGLARVRLEGHGDWGVAGPDGFVSMAAAFVQFSGPGDVIRAGAVAEVMAAARGHKARRIEGLVFEMPLPDAGKILCVGVNFPDRNAEYKDGQEAPPYMSLFPRFAQSFTGHGQPLIRPPESVQLDYEGEIAVVIGKAGRRIPEAEALTHVAALTLCNEGTIRDWVRHAKFNVTQGKNWDRSGAMGPWLVPFTDAAQIADVEIVTRVNGEIRQRDRTGRMLFRVARQIAYISSFCTLHPGDVIVTGTPTGAGARFDPPRWLVPGDVVEVSAEGLGRLVNGVEDEAI